MTVIVTDTGFHSDDWVGGFFQPEDLQTLGDGQKAALAVTLANSDDPDVLTPWIDQIDLINLEFPVFSDGRAFSQATRLRRNGFQGRLRASGHVISDQFGMALRCGIDEVAISIDHSKRQPQEHWIKQAANHAASYQSQLRQID